MGTRLQLMYENMLIGQLLVSHFTNLTLLEDFHCEKKTTEADKSWCDGAKNKTVMEENLLEPPKNFRLQRKLTLQLEND